MTNHITEAIRYREQAKKAIGDLGRATHDDEDTNGRLAWVALGQLWYLAGALLDERKQSLQPPAEKRGEAPDPLPEVLPVGTRMHDADPLEGEGRLADNRRVYVVKVPGGSSSFHHSRVDWAHYRRTHSQSPSREGEASPWFDGFRAWATGPNAMHRSTYQLTVPMALEVLERIGRAEAAEERAALAEQREREARATAEQWRNEANDNADAIERNRQERETFRRQRDEARARVAALEAAIRGEMAKCDRAPPCPFCDALNEALDTPSQPETAGRQDDGGGTKTTGAEAPDQQRPQPYGSATERGQREGSSPSGDRPGGSKAPPVEGQAGGREEGLTPEEAEGVSTRAIYDRVVPAFARHWLQLRPEERLTFVLFRRFAHSEGAAEAGKRVAERVKAASERARRLVGQIGGTVAFNNGIGLAKELEALAAELEKMT